MKIVVLFLFTLVAISSFVAIEKPTEVSTKLMRDTLQNDRQKIIAELKMKYADKLEIPADSVFKNIKYLKGKSVEGVLSVMNTWGHALGVTCRSCHEPEDWASEKKRNFLRTREMIELTSSLNKDLLPKMKNFRQPVTMGCISCHNEMKEPSK